MVSPDEQLRRVRNNTLRSRVPRALDTVRRNLETLSDKYTLSRSKPYRGRIAVVVGSGPGLDRNIHRLSQIPPGHPVIAVNSSLGALARRKIHADVAISIEPLAEPQQLGAGNFRTLVADWQAGPGVWERADAWLCSAGPNYIDLLSVLGVPPTPHGGSAANAALSMAAFLGADEICVIGQDLAHDLDRGKTYAQGAPWDAFEPALHQTSEGPSLHWSGAEERDDYRNQLGAAGVPRQMRAIEVPSWDGQGTVMTDVTLEMQRRWLMRQATVTYHLGGPRLTNATESGAAIPGFVHEPLESVIHRMEPVGEVPSVCGPSVPKETVARCIARIRAQGEASEWLSERMRDPELLDVEAWRPIARGVSWVEARTSCLLNDLEDRAMHPLTRQRVIYDAWRECARWAQGDQ